MRKHLIIYYFAALIISLSFLGFEQVLNKPLFKNVLAQQEARSQSNSQGETTKSDSSLMGEGTKKSNSGFSSMLETASEFTKSGLKKVKLKVLGEAKAPPAKPATNSELEAINKLGLQGEIVFDSSRAFDDASKPSFGIYALDLKNQNIRKIFNSDKQDIYPDVSPDFQKIVFAKAETLDRDSDSEIWIIDRDGKNPVKLSDGTFPTFSADGKKVYYERKRAKVLEYNLETKAEKQIFPLPGTPFVNHKVIKPRISSDGGVLYFTSDFGGRWTAWSYGFEAKGIAKIGQGCEPAPFKNELAAAWIRRDNVKAGSGIAKFELKTGESSILEDKGESFKNLGFGHEYFPSLTAGDKFLFYSACPSGQHSHYTANYQLFIKDLSNSETVRLSFDKYTNRWPKYLGSS